VQPGTLAVAGKKYASAIHISFLSAEVPTVTAVARSFWNVQL
jgi:hypothetical protein